jgi:hypothetical protein
MIMVRKIIGGVIGLVTFFILASIIQTVNGLVYGAPPPETMTDLAAMSNYVAGLPAGAFTVLLAGYIVGSYAGGLVARVISKWDSLLIPIVIGALGTIGWIANVAVIPHPLWVIVVGMFCFIPFTLLGHRSAKPLS